MRTIVETKTIITRITNYGRKPRTPVQALRQARDLLAVEGQWCQCDLFTDGEAEDAFIDGAVCGQWAACALGAIGLVTGDMPIKIAKIVDAGETFYQWDTSNMDECARLPDTLTYSAAKYLAAAIALELGDPDGWVNGCRPLEDPTAVVVELNDGATDRDRVLHFFDSAITLTRRRTSLEDVLAAAVPA